MPLYFLASIAGLFPGLILPIAFGFKAIHAFDVLFAACLVFTAVKRAFRPPDPRLIAAGVAFIAAGAVALIANPSPQGPHVLSALAYSVVVLLFIAHVRLDLLDIKVGRTILWPLSIAVGIAWIVLLIESLAGVEVARNHSPMLPSMVHRLGGFTGGNTLILFLCLAAPLVRAPGAILLGVIPTAFAALSRSVLGVGVGLILARRSPDPAPPRLRRAILLASWSGVALSVFIYVFAVIPVVPTERSLDRVSFEPGGYLTPHVAALRMLRSTPLVGIGPGAFGGLFPHFTSGEERERLPPGNRDFLAPHSAILGLAAEQGLLGLGAFAWFIFEIFKRLSRIEDPPLRSSALAGLTGLLVGGHFVDWLALKGLWFWIGLLVASRRLDPR